MIEELVNFCNEKYNRHVACPDCSEECKNACCHCLKAIHFTESTREYNCDNLCYWYVCQNIYRYSSEIIYLLKNEILGLQTRKVQINICSIGCGPCSELIAFEEYRKKRKLTFPYTFTGFDTNTQWQPIQEFIKNTLPSNDHVSFYDQDIFDHYKDKEDLPNLIILNYMLSSYLKSNYNLFNVFLDLFYSFVKRLPSCAILINDINLGRNNKEVRYYYDTIATKISEDNPGVRSYRFHFNEFNESNWHYGDDYTSSDILFEIPNTIRSMYNPNTECRSAQLLIIKPNREI